VTYSLTQNGCTGSASTAIVVNPSPTVAFEAEGTEFLVGVPVQFHQRFLGGQLSVVRSAMGEAAPSSDPLHTYTVPGDYTVTLTVESDGCTASADLALTVDVENGTTVRGALALHAWHVPGEWVIQLPEGISGPLVLDVMDASGRLHQRERWCRKHLGARGGPWCTHRGVGSCNCARWMAYRDPRAGGALSSTPASGAALARPCVQAFWAAIPTGFHGRGVCLRQQRKYG
jgi:PKD repeat protein